MGPTVSPLKIHRPRSGSNPRTLGPVASTLTTSPPKSTPSSFTGPYIRLRIFLAKVLILFSSHFVVAHVSAPYSKTGLINVL
jgi:hypothetical protein